MSARCSFVAAFIALCLVLTTLTLITHFKWDHSADLSSRAAAAAAAATARVPLEIHIMSKCPDAQDCLEMMVAPAVAEVAGMVDFRMSFIGRPTQAGISCLHGPSECLSNTLHLCASHHYPTNTSLPFSLCLTHNYTLLPQQPFIEACAAAHNVNFTLLNDCASDIGPNGGMALLRRSVERSRRVGAEVSCTVRVEGERWCVRDGGEWRGCEDGTQPGDLVRRVRGAKRGLVVQGVRGWLREQRIVWRE